MDKFLPRAFLLLQYLVYFSVECQSASEMIEILKKEMKDTYWPDYNCLPYGWDTNFKTILSSKISSPEKLLDEMGLKGLYKIHQITKQCDSELNAQKGKIKELENHLYSICHNFCILEKLQFKKNKWTEKPFIFGDLPRVVNSFKELFTRKSNPTFNTSLNLFTENFVRYLMMASASEVVPESQNQTCWETGSHFNPVDHVMSSLRYNIFCPGNREYPFEVNGYVSKRVSWKDWIANHQGSALWPNVKIIKGWNKPPSDETLEYVNTIYSYSSTGSGTGWDFYHILRDCRLVFNFTTFKQERGGDIAAESCAKICVLNKLGLITHPYSKRMFMHNVYDRAYTLTNYERYVELTNQVVFETIPEEKNTEFGIAYNEQVKDKLYEAVANVMFFSNISKENTCSDIRWQNVFKAVDCVFGEKNSCPTTSKDGQPIVEKLWPDFHCISGWYDANKYGNDLSSPGKEAGARLLDGVNVKCKTKQNAMKSGIDGCTKMCIMQELSLIRVDPFTKLTELADVDTFIDRLSLLLTATGKFLTLSKVKENLYPILQTPITWEKLKGKSCNGNEWNALFSSFEKQLNVFVSPSCQNASKPSEEIVIRDNRKLDPSYMQYTANINLSCHPSFNYKGLNDGDVVGFKKLTKECSSLLRNKSVTDECMATCIFHKMGILSWDKTFDERLSLSHDINEGNPVYPFIFIVKKTALMLSFHLQQYFTGPGTKTWTEQLAKKISTLCYPLISKFSNHLGCQHFGEFEDCVENIMSCMPSGQFQSHIQQPSDVSGVLEWSKVKYNDQKIYPDLSCLQGYPKSEKGANNGSTLLNQYKLSCQQNEVSCKEPCVLEQLGIFDFANIDEFGGKLMNVDEMTKNLNKVLTASGGKETSNRIANSINNNCKKSFEIWEAAFRTSGNYYDNYGCYVPEWQVLYACVKSNMECTAFSILGSDEIVFDRKSIRESFMDISL